MLTVTLEYIDLAEMKGNKVNFWMLVNGFLKLYVTMLERHNWKAKSEIGVHNVLR